MFYLKLWSITNLPFSPVILCTDFPEAADPGPGPRGLRAGWGWTYYSVRRLSTGSAMAALMEWKPTVMNVITTAIVAARGKTHQAIVVR